MNSKRRRRSAQMPLPFGESPPRAHTRERGTFYEAVQYLRAKGYSVYRRSGSQSSFSGRLVANAYIERHARKLGWGS
jgi:hypothetical protein